MNEKRGKPFTENTYPDVFAEIRTAAVEGIPEKHPGNGWIVEPCPSLATFTDQDFRDTAVTWLANAGASIPEITSITGHSEKHVYDVLRHYLGQDPERADAAIGKLVAWLEKKGAAL